MRKIRAAALSLLFACGLGLAALGQTTVTAQTTLNGGSSSPAAAGGLFNQVMSTTTPTIVSTGLSGWLNQGSATATNVATGLQVAGINGQFWQVVTKTPPATPYSITALVTGFYNANGNNGIGTIGCGIGWSDGTKFHTLHMQNATLLVSKFTNATTFSANDYSNGNFAQYSMDVPLWLKIKDDGTNVVFYFSVDGVFFEQLFSTTKVAGFLGSSGYSTLWFGPLSNGAAATCTLLSWAQGTS